MAGRIQGITVEIGGDTTKLSSALQGVRKEIKSTQSQLKDVEKLLKLDPSNTELLSQKQKMLTQAISETKEKLATLLDTCGSQEGEGFNVHYQAHGYHPLLHGKLCSFLEEHLIHDLGKTFPRRK
jgi:phage-related minor tail protein